MAHLRHFRGGLRGTACGASKGGAAKLKAYVAAMQRASAGEAHPAQDFVSWVGQRRLTVCSSRDTVA